MALKRRRRRQLQAGGALRGSGGLGRRAARGRQAPRAGCSSNSCGQAARSSWLSLFCSLRPRGSCSRTRSTAEAPSMAVLGPSSCRWEALELWARAANSCGAGEGRCGVCGAIVEWFMKSECDQEAPKGG